MHQLQVIYISDSNQTFYLDVPEFAKVKDVRKLIINKFNIISCSPKSYFEIIYKNYILNNEKIIEFYKLFSDDVIRVGNIESIIQENEVILEVFLAGWFGESINLIVNKTDKISCIKSIINDIVPELFKIDIWDINGGKLFDHQVIEEISTKFEDFYKIIVGLGDINNERFNECRLLHDLVVMENYQFINKWIISKNPSIFDLINYYQSHVLSDHEYENWNFSGDRFRNCKILFPTRLADRIIDFLLIKNQSIIQLSQETSDLNLFDISINIFRMALQIVFFKLCIQKNATITESMNFYLKRAIMYVMKYQWNIVNKLFSYLILWNFNEYENLVKTESWYNSITVKSGQSVIFNGKVSKQIKTVFQAKLSLSIQTGLNVCQLYLIDTASHRKPRDDDFFKFEFRTKSKDFDEYFFEIILNLNNIELLKKLGEGEFGSVHLFKNKLTNQLFVIKRQRFDKALYRDISIHSRFHNSAYIFKFYGLYQDGISICVAVEYLSGGSLRSYLIEKGIIPEKEIAKICHEILLQLKEIHDRRVIHRDIRCDNVVFDSKHSAKLIDFGISKCTSRLTEEKLLENLKLYKPGNLYFLAPEILNSELYTETIDIWSLGAMIIEILSGKPPNYQLTPIQAAIKVAKERKIDFSRGQSVSSSLLNFINDCLNPDPRKRSSCEDLLKSEFLSNYYKFDGIK